MLFRSVGFHYQGIATLFHGYDEKAVLQSTWDMVRTVEAESNGGCQWVGFYSFQFDLPFLLQRSFANRVRVPLGVRAGRYWGTNWLDLFEQWNCGKKDKSGSLDEVARVLGVGRKTGSGADFAALYSDNQEKALDYLRNDLELTARIGEVLL